MSNDFELTEVRGSDAFDMRWMASEHGLSTGQSGTLDLTDPLVQGIVEKFKGNVPSGTVLGYNETTKRHVIFDASSADDFRKVIAGVLYADVDVTGADRKTLQKSMKAPISVVNRVDIKRQYLPIEAQRTITYLTTSRAQLVFV